MILPAFGIISRSSRPSLASPCLATRRWSMPRASSRSSSFTVWAHHMFLTGMPAVGELFFMCDDADRGPDRGEGLQLGRHLWR